MKKLFCLCVFSLAFCLAAFSKEVELQVVQSGGGIDDLTEISLVLEDEAMKAFFNAGYIVTNEPAVVSKSEEYTQKLYDMLSRDALGNGCYYAIQIFLQLDIVKSRNPAAVRLENVEKIEWKATALGSGKVLGGTFAKPSQAQLNSGNVKKYLSAVLSGIVKEL